MDLSRIREEIKINRQNRKRFIVGFESNGRTYSRAFESLVEAFTFRKISRGILFYI